MELIKSTTFTNSYTYEHLVTIALYQSEFGYEIINIVGAKSYGEIRTTRMESEDYYLDLVKETKKAFNIMQQPFNTTETK
jgi:hypothetical protein